VTTTAHSRSSPGRPIRRIALLLAGAGLIGVLTAGCGIPASSGPQAIAKGNIPSRLLNPGSTTTSTNPNPPPVYVTEQIYLVDPNLHLTPRNRNIAPPANLTQIVDALLLGPIAAESAEGIQSFVTSTSPLSGSNRAVVTVANGIATVNFATNPVQVVGAAQTLLAIAQVVFTVTQQPNVTGVLFQIAGQPIEVPIGPNGALVPGPVNQAQYPAQAPVPTATP
jgi:spore germination protein GerM